MTAREHSTDPRPAIHCTASSGWVNDPVGLVHHGGRYHLFYQYVPDVTDWRPHCSWGHASSTDLMSWTEHEAALSPGDGDLGCWSGRVFTDEEGVATIYYTSVNEPRVELGVIREAEPVDEHWEAWRKGPVVATPPDELDLVAFRDPTVFRDGSVWRMLVGAGYADGRAAVLSYSSADLRTWAYDGPALEREPRAEDGLARQLVWECPHITVVDGRHVLVASVWVDGRTEYVEAAVGRYTDGRFVAEEWQRLTYGGGHYAASPFTDAEGREGLMFWVRGVGGVDRGWAGALSIPYALAVEGTTLRLRPHPEVRARRPSDPAVVGLDWAVDGASASLDLVSETGRPMVTLDADRGSVRVSGKGGTVVLPPAPGGVAVVADHGLLEVCTGTAVATVTLSTDDGPAQWPEGPLVRGWWPA